MKEEEKIRADKSLNDRLYEPKNDVILQNVAFVLVPIVFIFGIEISFIYLFQFHLLIKSKQ